MYVKVSKINIFEMDVRRFGHKYRVAIFYLTVSEIIVPSLKSI